MSNSSDQEGALAMAIGPIVALITAGVMAQFRGEIGSANIALILAGVVVVVALAGRYAGLLTALTAAVAYNYFHTLPYHSLRISSARDIVTVVLLAAIGLIVSEMSAWRRRAHNASSQRRRSAQALEVTAALLARGAEPDEVWSVIQRELTEGLSLAQCLYEPGSVPRVPPLPRSGSLAAASMQLGPGGFILPEVGVSIPVSYGGQILGHIVIVPGSRQGSTIDDRQAAVALADQFAVALAIAERSAAH